MKINEYIRRRNLTDLKLIQSLCSEIVNIGGMEFKYIFKSIINDNTLLRESTFEYIYQNGFSTLGQLETASYEDSQVLINEFNMFNDERVRVVIDYQNWIEDARAYLEDPEFDEPPSEGDLMILVNEDYSYDVFQIATVDQSDHHFQFNNRIFYRIFLKKYSVGEDLMSGFEAVSEKPVELQMQAEISNVKTATKPDDITTPQFDDFDIDNLDDLL